MTFLFDAPPMEIKNIEDVIGELGKFKPSTSIVGGIDGYEAGYINEMLDKWWGFVWQEHEKNIRTNLTALLQSIREEIAATKRVLEGSSVHKSDLDMALTILTTALGEKNK